MNIESLYGLFKRAGCITTDSRNCPVGSIFFALKGENFNGNTYAELSLDKGCSYVVVDEKDVVKDKRFILVESVLVTLQKLANFHRRMLALPIIGITGSNGKTTTKELLASVLKTQFNLHYTQGNFNNHIGVPLTLLQLNEAHEMAIIEMGANHPGEIRELCAIAEPDMGIITNIGKAHLEGFGGIDGVIKTKNELYDFVRAKNGRVFVNGNDELLMSLSEGIERTFYNDERAAFQVEVLGAIPALTLNVKGEKVESVLQTQLVGEYNCLNVAVALAVGCFHEIPFVKMKEALEHYVPSNNRSQIVKTEHNTIVLDAYNANPASMAVAVSNFIKLEMPDKVVLLGAMKELGIYSEDEHNALVDKISGTKFKIKIVVGQEFCDLKNKPEDVHFFTSVSDVKTFLKDSPIKHSTVLIKGSRSMKMEELVSFL